MSEVAVFGAGCTGPLVALLLARRGHVVTIYERRADPRTHVVPPGRSINLALADRGIRALRQAGLMDQLRPALVPMHSRMIHEPGRPPQSLRYGQRDDEVLWSASRANLHRLLIEAAVAEGVHCRFGQSLVSADFRARTATLQDETSGHPYTIGMVPAIGADGTGSMLRSAMADAGLCTASEDLLAHRYKELHIAPNAQGQPRLDSGHLHIWPRGGHMLIALPNADNSFTATLFMPTEGAQASFQALSTAAAARTFFAQEFPDVLALIADFDTQYASHPVGRLATIYTDQWHVADSALLIGDAAHGVVPFHGQGLNCCFEDCLALDRLWSETTDWERCFARFTAERRPNADAIARMAIENYQEMRDTVRDPLFQLQKALSLTLERRHPQRFIPRYSMVMFHGEIPYAEAERRGALQREILDAATRGVTTLAAVDLEFIDQLILERLTPLDAATS
ncbi:MAG: NAD(P)/FAD-dependent oxidoreductase [Pseudomonadota bacterium]|jgi:kynurenine 3-monooxygenase